MPRMPRFREVPPLRSATIGLIIIAAVLVGAFTYPKLPFVAGTSYKADFTDSGGLEVSDVVQVAGTEVGHVTGMKLVGNKVQVTFTVKKIPLGNDATAAIKTQTLLGKRYLGVQPGDGPRMDGGDTIPLARTTTPYNVSRSIEDVTAQLRDFDKPRIEAALNAFSDAFQGTPANFKATFQNVRALSETISSRDAALRELLSHANAVSGVLNDRTEAFQKIVTDGNGLLAELQRREQVINDLFRQFNYVAEQVRMFVRENNEQLGPVLDELNKFLAILEKNNANLQLAIERVSNFAGGLGEGVASGPEFQGVAALHTAGDIFNYTDVLRQIQNPQAPRIPGVQPPSGTGSTTPMPQPKTPVLPGLPMLGGN
jgi:phospholipid/cholesterol/gamma-HCH transport system substrate-binding protein